MLDNNFLESNYDFIKEYIDNNNYILVKPLINNELSLDYDYIVINDEEDLSYLNLDSNNYYVVGKLDDLINEEYIKKIFFTTYLNSSIFGLCIQKNNNEYISSITYNYFEWKNNKMVIPLEDIQLFVSKGKDLKNSLHNLNNIIKKLDINDYKNINLNYDEVSKRLKLIK